MSAPSGCGKTTIVDRLLGRNTDWVRSVSVTTRKPRFNEKDGEDYFFIAEKAFEDLRAGGGLLESAKVIDHFYGTPKKFVAENVQCGKIVLLQIDVQGARQIRASLDAKIPLLTIFILPPSIKVLRERLEGRKTETPEQIQARIEAAQEEIKEAGCYDKVVVNKNLDETVSEIEDLIMDFIKERKGA
jgi:guanylate kinase